MTYSKERIPCPSCRSRGEDSQGNHLRPYDDGRGGWCYKESKTIWYSDGDEGERVSSVQSSSVSLSVVNALPIKAIPSRKISLDTCERYGVRSEVNEMDGIQSAVYYPYTTEDGTIVGYKKRHLPKTFSWVGKPSGLFGQVVCKKNAKLLIIVEGCQDVLAGWEILKTKGKDWNIVSIPNGANETGTVDVAVLKELEWITSHENVILMLDNDKPGEATATGLAELLVSQCNVAIAKLPKKDTSDCWEAGLIEEWYKAIRNASVYRPESIVEGKELDFNKLRTPKSAGIELPYPKLQKMTWGLRKGEISLITAASGIGKTTFAKEIAYHLVSSGYTVAIIALETEMEDVARSFVAMDNNVPTHRLIFNPDIISEEDYQKSVDWMFNSNQMHFFRHWGSIDSDVLRAKIMYYAKALKVDFVVFDHVQMAQAGGGVEDERKDIDKLFANFTKICVETGIGIIPIMHLKRVQGKKFNKGDEVELTDLRGSSGAEGMSWNVLAIERDQQGDNKDIVRLRVLKNRSLGFTGPADMLRYDHETGRLKVLEVEV